MTGQAMDDRDGELLRAQGLAFFGAVMAGQSHEVTNVLNIIHELIGLQSDMLYAAEQGRPVDVDKLKQIAGRIQNQVMRGESIVRRMNQFAHSVDCPVTVFDLKEALQQITALAQRSAKLAKTNLDYEFPDGSMPLETSPFGFKQAVFKCIEIALDASAEKRHITVGYRVLDEGARVSVTSADPVLEESNAAEKKALLVLLTRQLGGKLIASPGGGDPNTFLLFFPRPAANSKGVDMPPQKSAQAEDSHET